MTSFASSATSSAGEKRFKEYTDNAILSYMEKSLFANLRKTVWVFRRRFLKGMGMVFVGNCLLIGNPLLFRHAIQQEHTALALISWAMLMVTIAFVSSRFKYLMRVTFISISRDVEREVRQRLFEKIQLQTQAFFDRHGTGELLSRLTNDITTYRDVIGPGIMYPIFSLTIVIPGCIALFTISSTLATIALLPLCLIPLLNLFLRSPIYKTSHAFQEGLASIANMTQEHYSGIRMIKSYAAETPTLEKFKELSWTQMLLGFRLSVIQGLLWPFFTLVGKAITVIIVFASGLFLLRGMTTLSPADFASFMWIQSYIFFPVLMLGWVLPIYQRGRAAYERLVDIYEEPVEVTDKATQPLKIDPQGAIVFNHLSFSYPGSTRPALKNLTLSIKGGTFIGITGDVGAGKSTLLRVLNREYEIPRGMIHFGDHDIHDYPLTAFHRDIVTVEQLPFLFSKTIAENLRFGKRQAPQKEVEMVARFADLHDTILGFPKQYDTVIGERGVTLSGGQKQRVAMARAFLVNRSILLLDNIFSAVDAATEKKIFQSMKEHFQGKTVFIITHRVTILSQLDRILYMKEGEVVEDGPPHDLEQKEGYYNALKAIQSLGGNVPNG